jgi:hypothetical protein
MKYTTAKTILKLFRKEGRFNKKKQRARKDLQKEMSLAKGEDHHEDTNKPQSTEKNNILSPNSIDTPNDPNSCPKVGFINCFWATKMSEHFL